LLILIFFSNHNLLISPVPAFIFVLVLFISTGALLHGFLHKDINLQEEAERYPDPIIDFNQHSITQILKESIKIDGSAKGDINIWDSDRLLRIAPVFKRLVQKFDKEEFGSTESSKSKFAC
jgi:hypothetical protein